MSILSKISNFISSLSFRLYHHILLPLRYEVTLIGSENIGKNFSGKGGGTLFLSSHPSHHDASMVGFALWERGHRVNIWTLDFVFRHFFTQLAARNSDMVKLIKVPNVHEVRSPKHPIQIRRLIQRTIERLRNGEHILFFPAGKQKHTAYEEINGKSAVQSILKRYPDVKIMLVTVSGMWGSRFSKAVIKTERSDLKAHSWMRFIWNIAKIVLLNGIFFIPKRQVTIEFTPAGSDFPRHGTRKEINTYLERHYNKGYMATGEPLQKVSNYFWKTSYPTYEYHVKSYRYSTEKVPTSIRDEVSQLVAKKAGLPPDEVEEHMHLSRDLALDSLEITEILTELEHRHAIPKQVPKHISSVGHLMAFTAGLPVDYMPITGSFPEVREEAPGLVRAWQVCAAFVIGLFGFIHTHH